MGAELKCGYAVGSCVWSGQRCEEVWRKHGTQNSGPLELSYYDDHTWSVGEVGAPSQLGAEGHACWMHGVQVMGVVSVECGHTVAGRSFSCTLALCVLELTSWSYFFLFLGRARCTWDPWPSWQPWRPGHWDRRPPCECHSPCPAPLWGPGAVPAGSQAVCSQVTPQGHSLFFQLT